jgi:rhamnogalacturonan endolyase
MRGFLRYAILCAALTAAAAPRPMEKLARGPIALRESADAVFLSWRLLATDPSNTAFNVYRYLDGANPQRVNATPIDGATWLRDTNAPQARSCSWIVRRVENGEERESSRPVLLAANAPARPYKAIPLRTPKGYAPNDASPGDLDGDGEYEIVLHQAGRAHDNSQSGVTSEPILEAYRLDGTFLWRINLGRNIREGAHYTQFMVFDLDGDGRAEVACKTGDGTIDGKGTVLGDPQADHRNGGGHVITGPEYLTVFDGLTGAERFTTNYLPARGNLKSWGDDYGNRGERYLACVAYLDGVRPSLVMCRGYYDRTALVAWDFRGGRLVQRWIFDTAADPSLAPFEGQGNHNLSVADVDGDGRDEIVYGSLCIDDSGRPLWNARLGHGDAIHVSDLDPLRPGLEVFGIHEHVRHPHGVAQLDARTGRILWSKPSADVGRGVAFDIDPRYPGSESWAFGEGVRGLWDAKGRVIAERGPGSANFGIWWDGDLLRELLDRTSINKWDWQRGRETRLLTAHGCESDNYTKATPALSADLLGDWREEVIWRSADDRELRIYSTTIPTTNRLVTLMQDPHYRLSVAWQNVGYNQPPHTGFFLGERARTGAVAP